MQVTAPIQNKPKCGMILIYIQEKRGESSPKILILTTDNDLIIGALHLKL